MYPAAARIYREFANLCVVLFQKILFSLLFTYTVPVIAQTTDTSLTLPSSMVNSAIRNMELADSCSQIGDSIDASKFFLKIDPYFFVSSNRTTKNIDSVFANYLLTKNAKETYRVLFANAYNSNRTEAFTTFKRMLNEDQLIRKKLSNCPADSIVYSAVKKEMNQIDSPHFEYLFHFVKDHGWPIYRDGAMFADVIAMHDNKYMRSYLPEIKRSVIKGNTDPKFYYNILNRARPSNYDRLKNYKHKLAFDISSVLHGSKISELKKKEIKKAIADCGPIVYSYFVYFSSEEKSYTDFKSIRDKHKSYWLAWDVLVYLSQTQRELFHTARDIPYDFPFSKGDNNTPQLILYLLY